MRHPALLERDDTVLVLIDVQEAYRRVLHGWDGVVRACGTLVRAAAILGVPVVVTEQYPRGLGHTAPEIRAHLPADLPIVEKLSISCVGAAPFADRVAGTRRRQVLVAGIETHACVNQTVHDLLAAGHQVHVARDATSSRRADDVAPAWDKMRAAGMLPTSTEQALIELVRTAESPDWKAVQALLKG
jgi:nicotinamidase-related amidase